MSAVPHFQDLRLVLVGEEDGRFGHAVLHRRALERLGCDVHWVNPVTRRGWWQKLGGQSQSSRLRRMLESAMPDIVLVVGGECLDAATLQALRADSPARWVQWVPNTRVPIAILADTAHAYDHVFTFASDLSDSLAAVTGARVGVLPPAADPSIHRPLAARDQFRANVVFVGTATVGREELLTELVQFGLAVWGAGWRKTRLKAYCRGEHLDVRDYVRAYAGASVGINIHHEQDRDASEAGCNQRLFELAAIGTPQVVDRRGDLARHFTVDRDLLTYTTGAELQVAVRRLLADHRAARDMGRHARRTALARHTYMHRMLQLLNTVVGMPPSH